MRPFRVMVGVDAARLVRDGQKTQFRRLAQEGKPCPFPVGRRLLVVDQWKPRQIIPVIVEKVRRQRLQDLSEADLRAELGRLPSFDIPPWKNPFLRGTPVWDYLETEEPTAEEWWRGAFAAAWDRNRRRGEELWDANPEVWAVTFGKEEL